jgi:trk system potassium uptake protein TrkA
VVDTDPERAARCCRTGSTCAACRATASSRRCCATRASRIADLFIACAPLDETNLVACKVAHDVFNVPTTIARCAAPSSSQATPSCWTKDGFAVDHVICPEESVTRTSAS